MGSKKVTNNGAPTVSLNSGDLSWEGLLAVISSQSARVIIQLPGEDRVIMVAESEFRKLQRDSERYLADQRAVVLTPREIEVLREVGGGQSVAQTSARLGMSVNTATQHLATVRRKFAVQTTAAAVQAARRIGMVDDRQD